MDRYLPIPFNKHYFACSNGCIYNKKGRRIGTKRDKSYNVVYIKHRDTNKFKCYYVHRLIWITFNGEIPEGMEIDHINTIKNDNRLENLRLVTHKENCNNPKTLENYSIANKGEKHPIYGTKRSETTKKKISEANSKQLYQYSTDEKLVRIWPNAKEVEKELGIKRSNISACCYGKIKSAGGYIWSF